MIDFLDDNWKLWTSFGFSVVGATSLTIAFWPSFWHVYKTKDTKFLPLHIFGCHLLVGALITAGSICGLFGWGKEFGVGALLRTIVFTYLNGFLLTTTGYTVGLALRNKFRELEIERKKQGLPKKVFYWELAKPYIIEEE